MTSRLQLMGECFSGIEDPRNEKGKHHELVDILCLVVLAVIAGAEGWEDAEELGRQKFSWLKRFMRLPHGVPSHDTIGGR